MQSTDEAALRQVYQTFAQFEAHNISAKYEEFAYSVANSNGAIQFLSALPPSKQQPNLLFAAVRMVCGVAASGDEFCRLLLRNRERVRSIMLRKSTQTNEPARCAVLLPLLSRLPQPLALLEVGASAGLCLYPDQYQYAYGDHLIGSGEDAREAPRFSCRASENTPLPVALPEVVWRSGIDLNPLNVDDKEDVEWLEHLIWPEHATRLKNTRRAVAIARTELPHLVRGDLVSELSSMAAAAPAGATLVIFHSAVLAYVRDKAARDEFVATVCDLGATWISNEHPLVFPEIADRLSFPPPNDQFLLSIDGQPVASTGPHGQSIDWF